jgi:hypothetical protein
MHSQTEQMRGNVNDGIDRGSDSYKLGQCQAEIARLRRAMAEAVNVVWTQPVRAEQILRDALAK